MIDSDTLRDVLEAGELRRAQRRQFLRTAGQASLAVGGLSLLAACDNNDNNPTPTPSPTPSPAPSPTPSPTPTPTPTAASLTDEDVLNFALNLEYLEAQFYTYAVTGQGLPNDMLGGTGTQGQVKPGYKVPFSDRIVAQYAKEIAADESAHVAFLRSALKSAAVAMPDVDVSPRGAFTAAAIAAGVITAGQTFNPYASDENFLLGAFIFEDVGVTAYKGASILISNKTYLSAAAGILAAEAYHAGLVRTVLYRKGIDTPALITDAGKISDARDSLDGASDDDQGLTKINANGQMGANLVPTDGNSIAYSRSAASVLNIVYLNPAAVVGGGFFPSGVNGTISMSAANNG